MTFIPGARLGPYEIVALLGVGGMGEVYRATDTNLKRQVAIKFLPTTLATDPDRLARFQREAEVLAALNHPNIAHIFGLEKADGTIALVMELVEGPTLADRISQGAIPLAEALPIARQIAEALEAAHEQGIIHRDLKPANIKVREDGTVKVLDFGLAKAMDPAGASSANAMNSPTLSMHATQAGIILGTAAYMSPEQARGRRVDARADLWAFGAVLFEMLTGRRAFDADDTSATLAFVITKEPDWNALPASTPSTVGKLLRRCLENNPKRRVQAIGDARIDLEEVAELPDDKVPTTTHRSSFIAILTALSTLLVGVAATMAYFAGWARSTAYPAPPVTRLTLSVTPDNSLTVEGGMAISPDGRTVAFVARSVEGTRLYLRRLDEWDSRPVPRSDGARNPFFSPDGQWVGFFSNASLNKVPTAGGTQQFVCKVGANAATGRWYADGTILIGSWPDVGLSQVSSDGGSPQSIARPQQGSGTFWYLWPERLPNRTILLTVWHEGRASIAVLSPGDDTLHTVVESGSNGHYLPTGWLTYVSEGRLFGVPFDAAHLQTRGGARVLIVVWKDRHGVSFPIPVRPGVYSSLALSPLRDRFSVGVKEGARRNIWTGEVAGGALTRLTFGDDDTFGLWSPDGKRLLYTSGQNGRYNIFSITTDGSGKPERITNSPDAQQATAFSPDGDVILFQDISPTTGSDLWQFSLKGKEGRPLIQTRFSESTARFSPDGRTFAYQSNESGRPEVYVQLYPGLGLKRQVSVDGGGSPEWSHTGRELFYQTATAMLSAPMMDTHDLHVGPPVRLFELGRASSRAPVSPDDLRFLMLERAVASQAASQLNVVQNWTEELKRLVPTR